MRNLCTSGAIVLSVVLAMRPTLAGPTIPPGDMALRHDIQVLADYGIIKGPISTWPLDWSAIAADIDAPGDRSRLPDGVMETLFRV